MARFLARAFLVPAAFAALPLHGATPVREPEADRVVILANCADPDSLAIARHYAEARGVPAANLLAYPMSSAETIAWAEFIGTIWRPLQDDLVTRGWIDAVPLASSDAIGRRRYAVSGHRIAALVVCRGVPLRIDHDPALYSPPARGSNRPEFQTNAGAVDSELSLLARDGGYPINGFVPNPLYANDRPSEFVRIKVIKVSRLDAPSAADALALVDRALAAERLGLIGRAYVDRGGEIASGNSWLANAAQQLEALGFPTTVDTAPATMAPSVRCDAPVLYFGWHTPDIDGPFALPGFTFPTGAIAFHIHSYSAGSLRAPGRGWCGPLVAAGATATLGNVSEPFLEFTHRPDLFLRALVRGETLVDAAYYAVPVLSWQSIVIGDPLYRPFAVPLAAQMKNARSLSPDLAGYVTERAARLLEGSGKKDEALALLKQALAERPDLALGLALAERLRAAGRGPEAAHVLEAALSRRTPPTDRWALTHDAAEFLTAVGRPEPAVKAYRRLLRIDLLPRDLRMAWLPDAIRTASAALQADQAAAWGQELNQLLNPAPQK